MTESEHSPRYVVECTRLRKVEGAALSSQMEQITRYIRVVEWGRADDGVRTLTLRVAQLEDAKEYDTWDAARKDANLMQVNSHWTCEICEIEE